jgi:ATP-dependent Clp protease ATP-binding subunit ClpA
MTRQNWKVTDAAINAIIQNWGQDLTAYAQNAVESPAHFEESVIAVVRSLARVTGNSVCITGDTGIGKTRMIGAVAQYLAGGMELPGSLQGARVIFLDLDRMNAGAKFRGQLEERLKPLLDGIAEREGRVDGRKIILAFDDLSAMLRTGITQGGGGVVSMIKPFLMSRGVTILVAGTSQDYKCLIDKDPALGQRFDQVTTGMERKAETLAEIFLKGTAQPVRVMPALRYRRMPAGNTFTV